MNRTYDLLIKNVRVVRPHGKEVFNVDIAVQGGKFKKISPSIDPKTSTVIHIELRYSILIPFLILPCLQD